MAVVGLAEVVAVNVAVLGGGWSLPGTSLSDVLSSAGALLSLETAGSKADKGGDL